MDFPLCVISLVQVGSFPCSSVSQLNSIDKKILINLSLFGRLLSFIMGKPLPFGVRLTAQLFSSHCCICLWVAPRIFSMGISSWHPGTVIPSYSFQLYLVMACKILFKLFNVGQQLQNASLPYLWNLDTVFLRVGSLCSLAALELTMVHREWFSFWEVRTELRSVPLPAAVSIVLRVCLI